MVWQADGMEHPNPVAQVILGTAYHHYNPNYVFGQTMTDRLLHTYVIGQTGTGKSTLIENCSTGSSRGARGSA